ncbi:MAG: zinc-dependent peptidase [Flavobacteriales bacterium]|nr:zinc-dependent peptidase [Flavobacteriales bacterium]
MVAFMLSSAGSQPSNAGPALGMIITLAAMVVIVAAYQKSSNGRSRRRLGHPHRAILVKYAIHYQRLDDAGKQRMERIVSAFIHEKDWVGAGIVVKEEMKVMISACAAQLLLGFPDIVLRHFEKIVVYPETYRSPRTGRMHQGEVRPQPGIIIISWDDFVHGYAHSRDAHNVGLHELAHALWFEDMIENSEHNFLDRELLAKWNRMASEHVARIKRREAHYFRDYAGTNQAEFFAVAVEYFFEQPREFQAALPELYATMSALLKQDPAKALG